jgi:hypothetical protein
MADTVSLSPEALEILNSSDQFTRSQEFLQEMAKRNTQRDTWYRTYEDYYTSENQRVLLTDRLRRFLNRSGFMWCENFCEVVVDVLCERLIMDQFSSEDATVQDWLDEIWKSTRMLELQSIVHTNTVMKGDGYVIVDMDSATGKPRIHYNRPEIIKPIYDSEDSENLLFAAKTWKSQLETPTNPNMYPVVRMNLYWPNQVEKWFNAASDGSAEWAKHLDPGDTVWPIPWEDQYGEPLGVPVFHFKNKSKGKTWGVSEIRGTIPQQDSLNKLLVDLTMVLDSHGAAQRYGTGIKQEEKTQLSGNPGTLWTVVNPEARFGQFDAINPEGLLASIEAQLQRIAGRSRTPLFLLVLSGDAPSGESLKTAETGLVAKSKDRAAPLGNKWEDVFVMCAKIAQISGDLDSSIEIDSDLIDSHWRDPESRNVLEESSALATRVTQLGLSKHTALQELGYDPEEEAEYKDEETTRAVANFNAGLPTVPVVPTDTEGDDSSTEQ